MASLEGRPQGEEPAGSKQVKRDARVWLANFFFVVQPDRTSQQTMLTVTFFSYCAWVRAPCRQ